MPDFFFTFGCGTPRGKSFVRIRARDMGAARDEMFSRFGDRWAFCYDYNGWVRPSGVTQEDEFGLRELEFVNLLEG